MRDVCFCFCESSWHESHSRRRVHLDKQCLLLSFPSLLDAVPSYKPILKSPLKLMVGYYYILWKTMMYNKICTIFVYLGKKIK
jgi:hypothetical protein